MVVAHTLQLIRVQAEDRSESEAAGSDSTHIDTLALAANGRKSPPDGGAAPPDRGRAGFPGSQPVQSCDSGGQVSSARRLARWLCGSGVVQPLESEFEATVLSTPSITEVHREIVDEFEFLDDWMDRYQHLIDLGRKLPEYPAEFQTDEYKVRGCQAQVWFRAEKRDGRLYFTAMSDAAIVSGLIAILLRAYSGYPPKTILRAGHGFISDIGLTEHLSPTRGNGLHAMLRTIRRHAVSACMP